MLELPRVMLCGIDTVNVPLTLIALQKSMERVRFGDAVLITNEAPAGVTGLRVELIPPLTSRRNYSGFVLGRFTDFVTRDFVLLAQWDGYVVEPEAWRANFLKFDYIGARWPWHRSGLDVGNGGFSLRSRRLMAAVAATELPPEAEGLNEDDVICRVLQPALEKRGFSFAPAGIADVFAYERAIPDKPSFGFHGLFNLWRYVGDEEIEQLAASCPDYVVRSQEWAELTVIAYNLRKFRVLRALYARQRSLMPADKVRKSLSELLPGIAATGLFRTLDAVLPGAKS